MSLTIFRWLVFAACLAPIIHPLRLYYLDELGAVPEETLLHFTGHTVLILLLITISWGFLWRFTGWVGFIATRRQVGLWAFWWLLIHLLLWLGGIQAFQWQWILLELGSVTHLQLGAAAFLLISLLALTSPSLIRKAMPALLWRSLHRLIYLAAALGILHLWIVTRLDYRLVWVYALLLAGLLVLRLIFLKPPTRS
ncbi:MAG: ferric reductase-like transmembrane domain-containing protein [Marinospirillum sp.]|uniref:ferric reductase-like transmembrane domain-containing protein n=1 Tax=Marinospirillum sp. TaxID=2183934 RepID=UPI0019E2A8E7|nr:ferric reductase-like transmembrane domain-containing protein [Marinospirillum sp.]MBE0508569.1 ferric reductase-like transmembrane domain-containing protein [Marinospirillum sp.]